ncbi:MAG: alpha/beta fold hydrolase [Solirubrobacteraceae bacterium]
MTERRVAANGIDFTVLEAGRGPLALCLHGFPDSPHSFRPLLAALAAASFHAVAPFMRGYAPTSAAPDGEYGLGALAADANALHEALGGDERAVLIGRDWGAEATYAAALTAPARWRRLVTLAIPPLTLDERLFADREQRERFAYQSLLESPDAPRLVAADDFALVDRLWRAWSPGLDALEYADHAKRCLREPAHLAAALAYYRAPDPGPLRLTPRRPTLYLHGRTTAASTCVSSAMRRRTSRPAPGSTCSPAPATSSTSSSPRTSMPACSSGWATPRARRR